jgi:trehalose-phosphatase
MRHLFIAWKHVLRQLQRKSKILLLFDYDGTLTPIVSRPCDAVLDNEMRDLLMRLSKEERFNIGIVSGRKLSDVKSLVKIKGIYYAGNHGLELIGPDIRFMHPDFVRFKPHIKKIKRQLERRLSHIKGVIVEDKTITLSLHYRMSKANDVSMIKSVFKEITSPFLKTKKIRITKGKKVLEVRPPIKWDKGKALRLVEKLTKKSGNALTIYIGDDVTDEDAFKVLKKRGISIFVGKPKRSSSAKYYLRDTDETRQLLKLFLMLEKRVLRAGA